MANPNDPNKRRDDEKPNHMKKIADRFDEFSRSPKVEGFISFTKSNMGATIAYVVLFIGILLSIFHPFLGGLLIGVIGGIYFGDNILRWVLELSEQMDTEDLIKNLILGGIILGLFVQAPGIVLGTALVMAFKYIMSQRS